MNHKKNAKTSNQISFSSISAFESVARNLNFSKAAIELHLTPTAVSNAIKLLENQLGVRLFNRTTRSVSLTEPGERLEKEVLPIVEHLKQLLAIIIESSSKPEGLLKLTMTAPAFLILIEPHLYEFKLKYPTIHLDIVLENELVDIVANSYDAGIRLGRAVNQEMHIKQIGGPQKFVTIASPDFIRENNIPKDLRPLQLCKFVCIQQRRGKDGGMLPWKFRQDNEVITVDVAGGVTLNDMKLVAQAAIESIGIGYVFKDLVINELSMGLLEQVIADNLCIEETFHVYYPSQRFVPGKLRAFIDFFKDRNDE